MLNAPIPLPKAHLKGTLRHYQRELIQCVYNNKEMETKYVSIQNWLKKLTFHACNEMRLVVTNNDVTSFIIIHSTNI